LRRLERFEGFAADGAPPTGEGQNPVRSRFEGVAAPADPAPEPAPLSPSALERFSEAPAVESPLRVKEDDGGQPFTRCAACHFDNVLSRPRCERCGVDLRTPVQRAFNEAYWQRRLAEDADYAKEVEAFRKNAGEARDGGWRLDETLRAELRGLREPYVPAARLRRFLVRAIPDRRVRLVAILAPLAGLLAGAFWLAGPRWSWLLLVLIYAVGSIARALWRFQMRYRS
jgi:hypothetical protein